jgi:hypothetical protein
MARITALSPEQTTMLGKIAIGHAFLDGIMEGIVGALVALGPDHGVQERARTVVQGQSTSFLTRCIKRLASQSRDRDQALRKWAAEVYAASEERNKVLHAIWLLEVRKDESIVMRRPLGSAFDTITLDHLRDLVAKQDTLAAEGLELSEHLLVY